MKLILLLLVITCLINCKNKSEIQFRNLKYILNIRSIENGRYKLNNDGSIRYLFDTLNGKYFGNYFEFDLNSNLIAYAFKPDSMHSTYMESYDPESNSLLQMEGSPIVYVDIDADKNPNSLNIQYYFSEFSWREIDFEISEDGINYKIIPHSPHPKLKFISVAKYERDTKSLPRFYLIAKFKGKMLPSMENKIFYDTIDVTKNKR